MADEWDEKAVFLAASALRAEDRVAFLDGACPDEASRQRIEALLKRHTEGLVGAVDKGGTLSFGEFRVIREIGAGGMGVVYLAQDTLLDRQVAVKVLAAGRERSELAIARFQSEARSAAALDHPGIVPVYKFGFDERTCFIVSQYIDGKTLSELIRQEGERRHKSEDSSSEADWRRRVCLIVADVADALECAHRAQIIHRDVKPSNILVDRNHRAKLSDFGIAKTLGGEEHTLTGDVVGSCHYMSPEQAAVTSRTVDARSDVYSLGVVLYEAVALARPFDGGDVPKVLWAVVNADAPALRSHDRRIPKDLETICHRAMEKSPARRYQSAAQLGAELRCFLDGKPILATPPSVARRAVRWIDRRRMFAAVVSVTVLALVVLGLGMYTREQAIQQQAWVSVYSQKEGLTVLAQRVVEDSFAHQGFAHTLGTTPLRSARVLPGLYRLTVVDAGDAFVECNARLLEPGRENLLVVEVYSAGGWPAVDEVGLSGLGATQGVRVLRASLFTQPEETLEQEMVRVAAGSYHYGWDESPTARFTIRNQSTSVAEFFIDRTEVSNGKYREFVDATGWRWPDHWKRFGYDPSLADRPVVGVTLDDAEAYARWAGKRLPTAIEWEAAVRGPAGALRIQGGEAATASSRDPAYLADRERARLEDPADRYAAYAARVVDVGDENPSTTSGGLLHAYGNVGEMTESFDIERHAPIDRGIDWTDDPDSHSLASHWSHALATSSYRRGFRCARSASLPPSR